MSIIHYTHCPVCNSGDINEAIRAKDHTVSGETFTIMQCGHCSLRFTQDVPAATSIAPYYKSEDYISHTNTSKGLVNRLYQSVRKRTMRTKRELIEDSTGLEKGRLLDIGSGVGTFVYEMKSNGWDTTGLEPDADARSVAKRLYNIHLDEPAMLYQLQAGYFDAITLWHVLEHVHDLHRYMEQIKTLLAGTGKLFIAVPNYTSYDAGLYGEYWAAYDVPRHLYHFSPASINALVEQHGLKVTAYKPMWYDSFYISLLSSKYKTGKTRLFGAFRAGLRSNMKARRDVKKCSSVIYIISH